jgi:hypothetical protein
MSLSRYMAACEGRNVRREMVVRRDGNVKQVFHAVAVQEYIVLDLY